jgi:hypothetical protein
MEEEKVSCPPKPRIWRIVYSGGVNLEVRESMSIQEEST